MKSTLISSICLVLLAGIVQSRNIDLAGSICGGALTSYAEGGIFYKYNQPLNSSEELCVWTIVPGNSTDGRVFNGVRVELIDDGFTQGYYDDHLTVAYATESGQIVPFKTYDKGERGAIEVPSTVVFVILSSRFSTKGKGFALYYEGIEISGDQHVESLPKGKREYLDGHNGTASYFTSQSGAYNVFVVQAPTLCKDVGLYCRVGLKVTDFNTGVGPNGVIDTIQVHGIKTETGGFGDRLLIGKISTINGYGGRYNSPKTLLMAESGETFIVILKTGERAGYQYTKVNLTWQNGFYY